MLWRIADIFLLPVTVFPSHEERIAAGFPSLPIRELLSPPCVQMMTIAIRAKFTAIVRGFPVGPVKIKLRVSRDFQVKTSVKSHFFRQTIRKQNA